MKYFVIIISLFTLLSCSTRIKNTEWESFGENAGKAAISFKDSTCIWRLHHRELGELGESDTLHSKYELRGDTIVFKPVDEYVTIGNYIIRGDELISAKSQAPAFKLKK